MKIICTQQQKEKIIEGSCVDLFLDNNLEQCPLDAIGVNKIECKECFESHVKFEIKEDK